MFRSCPARWILEVKRPGHLSNQLKLRMREGMPPMPTYLVLKCRRQLQVCMLISEWVASLCKKQRNGNVLAYSKGVQTFSKHFCASTARCVLRIQICFCKAIAPHGQTLLLLCNVTNELVSERKNLPLCTKAIAAPTSRIIWVLQSDWGKLQYYNALGYQYRALTHTNLMMTIFNTTWHSVPEDCHLHICGHKNVK